MSFITDNSMDEGRRIRMKLVDGPFKQFNGDWHFEATPKGGCEATFRLDFEFSNGLLGVAFGGFFKEFTASSVDAFCKQAAKRYGDRLAPLKPVA